MIDYLRLRQLVGWVGLILPALLVLVGLVAGRGVASSISDYYYSTRWTRDILTGALCAIGVFLITYMGYRQDVIPVKIAAFAAIGVALCPTASGPVTGKLHPIFAGLLFIDLALIALFLFTKTKTVQSLTMLERTPFPGDESATFGPPSVPMKFMTRRKLQRNTIYRVCGIIMLTAMLAIPVTVAWLKIPYALLVCEAIVVEAFAISWLVKGRLVLKDEVARG